MADSRQPKDSSPQWGAPGTPEQGLAAGHDENDYSSYRSFQPGAAAAPYTSARENGFNGDLSGGHMVTAGKDNMHRRPRPPCVLCGLVDSLVTRHNSCVASEEEPEKCSPPSLVDYGSAVGFTLVMSHSLCVSSF